MATVTVRYWAAAKQAAGVGQETISAATLADAVEAALANHCDVAGFADVLARSSFLVDGKQAGRRGADSVTLREGAVVEVLPPFAGG